jgi:hypothetical protein
MFRKNKKHLQLSLISNVSQLPQWQRERLEQSWAGTFYRDTFCRINEVPFADLYSDIPSRPNVPINVLVGLDFMKSGFGWSDEEMQDEFLYNIQVRYALGYHELGVGEFDLRTVYNFRRRVGRYMQESGVNLVNQAFEQVTDEQMAAFALRTGRQRMDSTQVESNIRHHGRLQLLVEVLQRVHRMLNEEDKIRYAEVFEPYLHRHPGHYIRHLKKEEYAEHILKMGALMYVLLQQLRAGYDEEKAFMVLERVFGEHFRLESEQVKVKENKELSACSLQSPDDWEATVREKGNGVHLGYVANITETCDEQNPFQLITKVQVAPNHVDDPQLLVEALPNLAQRTKIDTLFSDGGYGSPEADQTLIDHDVVLFQSAIRGHPPAPDKLSLSDFHIELEKNGKPLYVTCPHDQRVAVRYGNQGKGFVAEFDPAICQACSLIEKCPAKQVRRNPLRFLYFLGWEAHVALRRQRIAEFKTMKQNPRAAIEATIRAVKHPFRQGKLPVRGSFRVFYMLVGSAVMNNVRQIQRYLAEQNRLEAKQNQENMSQDSFCFPLRVLARSLFQPFLSILGC